MTCEMCLRPCPKRRRNQRWCGYRCGARWRAQHRDRLSPDRYPRAAERRTETARAYKQLGVGTCGCGAERWLYLEGHLREGARVEDELAFVPGERAPMCSACVARRDAALTLPARQAA